MTLTLLPRQVSADNICFVQIYRSRHFSQLYQASHLEDTKYLHGNTVRRGLQSIDGCCVILPSSHRSEDECYVPTKLFRMACGVLGKARVIYEGSQRKYRLSC